MVSAAIASAGLAAAVTAAVYAAFKLTKKAWLPKEPWRILMTKQFKRKNAEKESKDKVYAAAFAGGIVAVLLLSQGNCGVKGVTAGAVFGLVVANVYLYIERYGKKARRLRETAVLYLLVDMSLKSGYTLLQSLRAAIPMVPGLARHIERCIQMWGNSPVEALEYLRLKINLPEADALISVLIQVQEMGGGKLCGAMQEGSKQLQNLRRALVKSQAAGKPLAFSVFRLLPLGGAIGIVVGPLVVQLTEAISLIFEVF